jgi:hypothetical protein
MTKGQRIEILRCAKQLKLACLDIISEQYNGDFNNCKTPEQRDEWVNIVSLMSQMDSLIEGFEYVA